jgi:hypothetical protein
MPRRHVVKDLSDEEFEFVIQRILEGDTDRELSTAFQTTFEKRLAKSSLNRWRDTTGNELAERYRLARFQARQLLENLKEEDADKHQVLMRTVEDRLLTATREVIKADPLKLLRISQAEQKRKLQEQRLQLQRDQLDLEREKLRGAAIDRISLFNEFMSDLLAYIDADKEGLNWFNKHLKKFGEFIKEKYAPAQ